MHDVAVEVRRRLGTCSYTTITTALREWVKPEGEEAEELEPMPEAFEERLMQAGADLFALTTKIAGEQFQAERDEWAAERARIENERDEAIRLADLNSAELDDARDEVKTLECCTRARSRGSVVSANTSRRQPHEYQSHPGKDRERPQL